MARPRGASPPSAAVLTLLRGSLLLSSVVALALPVTAEAQAQATCVLAGTWVNELGSKMTISAADSAGQFSGSYLTAVTASNQPVGRASLWGSQHHPSQRAQPTFGFTVQWASTGSVTVFAGQCFVDADGQETLETTWLLRKEAAAHADDWKATL
ncbi:hypothetical protein lerEdw1_010823 [Lerista edwardsae]|nr:hypothetical protein lerEdw1_010823 [Lerista edwardsae]